MKQVLWMGLLILALTSCKQTPQEMIKGPDGSPSAGSSKPDSSTKPVTDTSICKGNPPTHQTIFGSWSADYVKGDGKIHQTFTLEAYSITLHVKCARGTSTLSLEARSNAAITEHEVDIKSNSHSDGISPDGQFQCTADLKASELMTYSFVGPCLNLKSPVRDMLLLPGN